jgi:hypothetical protein
MVNVETNEWHLGGTRRQSSEEGFFTTGRQGFAFVRYIALRYTLCRKPVH